MPPRRERAKITDRLDVHARETDALIRLEAAKHRARAGAGRAGRTGRTARSSNPGHPPVSRPAIDGPALPSVACLPGSSPPRDTVTARRVLLDGFARDADIPGLMNELAPLHPRNNTFPGEVLLHVAPPRHYGRAELVRGQPGRAGSLPLQGLRERFLPECTFRGRQNSKLQYTVLAAAALHGGTEPDWLEEVTWWQTDDFWQSALFAAVAYIHAATNQADAPVRQACQDLAQRPATRRHNAPFGAAPTPSRRYGLAAHSGGSTRAPSPGLMTERGALVRSR
jgi:hypothetical protein